MVSLFQNMCRTCMQNKSEQEAISNESNVNQKITQMFSIFSVPVTNSNKEISLGEIMKTVVPQLKINRNDKLPKDVCLECSVKINEIYRFQQNCLSVQEEFYKRLQHESNDAFADNQGDGNIFKAKLNNTFQNKHSMKFDDSMDDDINNEIAANEEFNESDLSDIDWDENCNSDWEEEFLSKSKRPKSEVNSDEICEAFCYDYDNQSEPSTTKKPERLKHIGSEKMYPCGTCKRRLKSKLSLKKHQEMHNEKDKEERRLECNICNKVFGKRSHLKDHSRTHIGEKPFLCSECGKGFTTAGTLKQHSYRHLNKTQFPCPDCPRSFPTKTDLYSHSNIHKAMPKKNICDICGRGFKKPFLLKQHKMYHNNERPYNCEFCEKSFVTNEKLKRHTRIHTGEKPFKCKYCEKAYCQSSELVKHVRCHLGENVYQCELCPLRFPSAKILREHFSTHKNDDEESRARNLAELSTMELKGIFFK